MKEFLRFLTPEQWGRLGAHIERRHYESDDVILAEGEKRRALFFIRDGAVRIEREHMGFGVEISRLEAGEIFGEMSFVEDSGASASAVAEGPVEVDVVDEADIRRLIQADPDFYGRFYQSLAAILSRRLRETTVRSISEYSWGGRDVESLERPAKEDAWGGGSPLRDTVDE